MGELLHGSPSHRPLSMAEFIEWAALIGEIEPAEAQEAQQQQSQAHRGLAGRRRR